MLGRVRKILAAVPSQTPERVRLGQAIKEHAKRVKTLAASSAEVERWQEKLDLIRDATDREREAQAAVDRAPDGQGATLLTLHADLSRARDELAKTHAAAQGAPAALKAAKDAEEEARSAVREAEEECRLARQAVMLSEYASPLLEKFAQASRQRNEVLKELHGLAYATWTKWGGGVYKDGKIYEVITTAIQENSPQFPNYDALALSSIQSRTRLAEEVREIANAWKDLAARLSTDPDATR